MAYMKCNAISYTNLLTEPNTVYFCVCKVVVSCVNSLRSEVAVMHTENVARGGQAGIF